MIGGVMADLDTYDMRPITVGDICLRLQIDPKDKAVLFFKLFKSYHEFMDDSFLASVELEIKATLKEGIHNGVDWIPDFRIDGDLLGIDLPGIQAQINFKRGLGSISIHSKYPELALEIILRQITAILAVRLGGLLVHGVGVTSKDKGFLFIGPSGAGKTTIARLSKNGIVLNDDLIYLAKNQNTWYMHSTPFSHPDQVRPRNTSHPLNKILRIVQDRSVYLAPMTPGQALGELISNIPVTPIIGEFINEIFSIGSDLTRFVPFHYLHFLPDQSFWDVLEGYSVTNI